MLQLDVCKHIVRVCVCVCVCIKAKNDKYKKHILG